MARVSNAAPAAPVPHNPADYAAALQEIARLRAEVAAAQSRGGSRKPGFYPRTVPVPKKAGSLPGRALADIVIPGGIVLSAYVGANGKCTFGGGFGSRGFGLWGAEVEPFLAFCEGGGMRAALTDARLRGVMADRWTGGADE
jgi:hypothetical protein